MILKTMSKILLIKQLQKKLLKKSKLSFLSKNISTLILITYLLFIVFNVSLLMRFSSFKKIIVFIKKKPFFINPMKSDHKKIMYYYALISSNLRIKNCLHNSICIHKILKFNSYEPTLHIGVDKIDVFKSHAWVQLRSKKIFNSEDGEYNEILVLN